VSARRSLPALCGALLAAFASLPAGSAPLQPSPDPQQPDGARPGRRTVRAARRRGPIVLDGKLTEPAWQDAELAEGFTQVQPDEGKPESVPTRFRVLWGDAHLYIGVECDDPAPLMVTLSRRDRWIDGDHIDIDLETTLDRRTAYHFTVYASGQQLDGLHFNDTDMTTEWDAAWESAVAITPGKGWSVEIKIPLRALRIPEGARAIGLQLARIVTRRNEEARWQFVPKDVPGYVSTQMGLVTGLDGIRPVRQLELRPYLALRAVHTSPAPAVVAAPGRLDACPSVGVTPNGLSAGCAGLDLRYGLSSDLSLIATINPDFGQVEADQRVLNLSTFETFFPEKRPFFLEGFDLFQPPVKTEFGGPYGGDAFQLFYSRRIGRAPPLPDLTRGDDPLDSRACDPQGVLGPRCPTLLYLPTARSVAEAMKLSGSIGNATVGALSSIETPVSAQLLGGGGAVREQRVADAVHSAAARVRLPLGDHALLGATGTAVDPLFAAGARHAHAGGLDLNLFDSRRDWQLQAQVAGSRLTSGVADVERDGTVLGDGSSGAAASLKAGRAGGDVTGYVQGDYLSPQFTTNDLGFMRRANLARVVGAITLRDVHPSSKWQSAQLTLSARQVRNAAWDVPLETDAALIGSITFNSFWYTAASIYAGAHGYDDRELRDGTPFERPGALTFTGVLGSDTRRVVSGELDLVYQRRLQASFSDSVGPALTLKLRPFPQFEAQLDLGATVTRGDVRSLGSDTADPAPGFDRTQQQRLYFFAPQDSRSVSGTLHGTLAFSPSLTLQAYAQLFSAGVSYHAPLRYLAAPGRVPVHLGDLSPALPDDPVPAGEDRQAGANVNLILRWQWALGSTIYLVYAHATSNDFAPAQRGLDLSSELSAAFQRGAVHSDTLLVKMDLLQAL
jgi:hypothetical protein